MASYYTLIWLSAESFRPVMSKTFTQVVIGRPYFLDAEGYKHSLCMNQHSDLIFL